MIQRMSDGIDFLNEHAQTGVGDIESLAVTTDGRCLQIYVQVYSRFGCFTRIWRCALALDITVTVFFEEILFKAVVYNAIAPSEEQKLIIERLQTKVREVFYVDPANLNEST